MDKCLLIILSWTEVNVDNQHYMTGDLFDL